MIQVIHRAFDIIEFIAKDPDRPKPLSEIAGSLQLNAGTCANIIKTMVERQYIDKVDKKGYVPGSKAYNMGGAGSYKRKLQECAREEMETLTGMLNENSELTVLQNNMRVVLLRISSNHDLQVRAASERVAYDTASGRIMLAFLPEDTIAKFVEKYGLPTAEVWKQADTGETFYQQLKKLRTDGYAIYITQEQIFGIAVPIYMNGKAIAAMGMYRPTFRYNSYDKNRIVEEVVKSGKRISEKLMS